MAHVLFIKVNDISIESVQELWHSRHRQPLVQVVQEVPEVECVLPVIGQQQQHDLVFAIIFGVDLIFLVLGFGLRARDADVGLESAEEVAEDGVLLVVDCEVQRVPHDGVDSLVLVLDVVDLLRQAADAHEVRQISLLEQLLQGLELARDAAGQNLLVEFKVGRRRQDRLKHRALERIGYRVLARGHLRNFVLLR